MMNQVEQEGGESELMETITQSAGSLVDEIHSPYPMMILENVLVERKNIIPVLRRFSGIDESFTIDVEQRRLIEQLSTLLTTHLHVITKLNFHREELFKRNTVFFNLLHPFTAISNHFDLYFYQKCATHYLGL
jgi:hypothetical protein